MFFLQIIGGIVLFIILAIFAFYLYIRIKLGKWFSTAFSDNTPPLTIHLNEDLFPEWLEDKKAKEMIKTFESHGFRSSKSFSIPEMNDVQLISFFKEPYMAVLYKHNLVGMWIDLVAETEDGKEINVTDMPIGADMTVRPEMTKVVMKGSNIDEMLDKLYGLTSEKTLKTIKEEEFRFIFEDSYKKEMKWKNRNGGVSYEDFISVAKEENLKLSDEKIQEAFIETKLQELRQWHHAVIEQYSESNNLKEDDKYDLEWRSVIVPSKTDPVSYAHYLKEVGLINDKVNLDKLAQHFKGKMNISDIFKSLNENLSPDLRATKAGSFQHPLSIDIYLIPESAAHEFNK